MTTLASPTTNVKPTRPNPPETWPGWTDRYRWTIAPDANPAAPCPAIPPTMGDDEFRSWKRSQIIAIPADEWSLGLASTHLLTALVIERVEGGEDVADSIDAVWLTTDPEFRAEVIAYIRMFDPAWEFAGWIASCLVGDPLDRPGPDGDPYTPTDAELAELAEVAGWEGDGDDLPPCPDEEPDWASMYPDEEPDWASMYPDEEPDWASMYPDFDPHDPAERVEVLGHRAYATALA